MSEQDRQLIVRLLAIRAWSSTISTTAKMVTTRRMFSVFGGEIKRHFVVGLTTLHMITRKTTKNG